MLDHRLVGCNITLPVDNDPRLSVGIDGERIHDAGDRRLTLYRLTRAIDGKLGKQFAPDGGDLGECKSALDTTGQLPGG